MQLYRKMRKVLVIFIVALAVFAGANFICADEDIKANEAFLLYLKGWES